MVKRESIAECAGERKLVAETQREKRKVYREMQQCTQKRSIPPEKSIQQQAV